MASLQAGNVTNLASFGNTNRQQEGDEAGLPRVDKSAYATNMRKAPKKVHPDDMAESYVSNLPDPYVGAVGSKLSEEAEFRRSSVIDFHDRVADLAHHERYIIRPDTSKFMKNWDLVLALALLFTAGVTPLEIAFFTTKLDSLFFTNRMVDIVFIVDIVVNFHLAYFDTKGRRWVTDLGLIRWRYAMSWLALDIVSTMPFDIFDVVETGASMGGLKILRILKLLKLAKLLRMLKASRSIKAFQEYMGLSNATTALITHLSAFLITIHWIACLWGLSTVSPAFCWLDNNGHRTLVDGVTTAPTVVGLYTLCLYYSVNAMVMGESEATMPATVSDRAMSCLCMVLGGTVYAYLIGSVCGLLASRDPATKEFKDCCDLIQRFCDENDMGHGRSNPNNTKEHNEELQKIGTNLKDYFVKSESMFRERWYAQVYQYMSPALRNKIADTVHGKWIETIPFLNAGNKRERERFRGHIFAMLEPKYFPPEEIIIFAGELCSALMIITRGLAVLSRKHGVSNVMQMGDHFGEEIILLDCFVFYTVKSMTYLNVNSLPQDKLQVFIADSHGAYPETTSLMRMAKVRMSFLRVMRNINKAFRAHHGRGKPSKLELKEYRAALIVIGATKTAQANAGGTAGLLEHGEVVFGRKKAKSNVVERCMSQKILEKVKNRKRTPAEVCRTEYNRLVELTTPVLMQFVKERVEENKRGDPSVVSNTHVNAIMHKHRRQSALSIPAWHQEKELAEEEFPLADGEEQGEGGAEDGAPNTGSRRVSIEESPAVGPLENIGPLQKLGIREMANQSKFPAVVPLENIGPLQKLGIPEITNKSKFPPRSMISFATRSDDDANAAQGGEGAAREDDALVRKVEDIMATRFGDFERRIEDKLDRLLALQTAPAARSTKVQLAPIRPRSS